MPSINDIPPGSTVAVAMSGGVDSTVAAHILAEKGLRVLGLTMKIWDGGASIRDAVRQGCYGPGEAEDLAAAAQAAKRIGIPHHVIDLSQHYKRIVLDYFRREYMNGRTPNPCVRCNHLIKFGALLEQARAHGLQFDYFATGHYARVRYDTTSKRHLLLQGLDPKKDQSYFLSRLEQAQLAGLLLPLGEMTKEEVKNLACLLGWQKLAKQPESQDFMESGDYSALFEAHESKPGPIVDTHGNLLGEHQGIIHYTIGQRRGLGLSGAENALYVVRIDVGTNTVVVGTKAELFATSLKADNLNWISWASAPTNPQQVQVKIRFRHKPAPAILSADPPQPTENVSINFNTPQSAITPGQTAVFYEGDLVLGSGTIRYAL